MPDWASFTSKYGHIGLCLGPNALVMLKIDAEIAYSCESVHESYDLASVCLKIRLNVNEIEDLFAIKCVFLVRIGNSNRLCSIEGLISH